MLSQEFRRHLHANPELSFKEYHTAEFIEESLHAEGIECRRIAETGVLARIEGQGDLSRAIVLRADIDALPVHEQTGLEYASRYEGVMHACGHDMHAAILFGVLQRLQNERTFEGTVFGLFQPGEECNPGGASKVLAENPFEEYEICAVLGEHTDSGLEVGEFGFCAGSFMASSDELRFWVRGRGGHAAMRDKIDDTVTAAAQLILSLNALNAESVVLSTGRVVANGATNVIPSEVAIEGTLRTFNTIGDNIAAREQAWNDIRAAVEATDEKYGTTTEIDISRGYPCVENDVALTATAERLCSEMFTAKRLARRFVAEDFGFYCEHYPSLFYRIGVGEAAGRSHSSTFAPDERAIAPGVEFMYRLALEILSK